jgi:hypothetical protein
MMNARPWSEIASGALTEEAVREMFPVSDGYRLYRGRYDVGVKFTDRLARAGRVYVFEGSCTFKTDTEFVHVKAGQYVDLSPADYEFEVPAGSPVRLMRVYHLPELIQR